MTLQLIEWIGQNKAQLESFGNWRTIVKFIKEQTGSTVTAKEVYDFVYPDKIIPCDSAQFVSWSVGYKTCAKGCTCYTSRLSKKMSELKLAYSPEKKQAIHAKRVETVQNAFGVNNVFQLKAVQTKSSQTKVEKYGAATYNNRPRAAATVFNRYGVANVMQLTEVAQKSQLGRDYTKMAAAVKLTKQLRHGSETYNNAEQAKLTCLQRYGTINPARNEQIRQKISKNLINTLLPKAIERYQITPLFDINTYRAGAHHLWKCNTCGSQIYGKISCGSFTRCIKCKPYNISGEERMVRDFVISQGENIIENSKKIISPKELDIFVPARNLAIEYCGMYWHSEKNGKDKEYHKYKLDRCNQIGIRLITLFSNEWHNSTDIVKSKISHLLTITQNRIHARKCSVYRIDEETANLFLSQNGLNGTIYNTVNYGLVYNNDLVGLMSFSTADHKAYTLEQFVIKQNLHIPGAASKLLSAFIKNYTPAAITAVNNNNWGYSKFYQTLGFVFSKHIPPSAVWIDNYGATYSSVDDISTQSYTPVWNCGYSEYVLDLTH